MEAPKENKPTGDENNSILSFSFTKKKDKLKLITSGLISESENTDVTVKKDFVTYLDVENKVTNATRPSGYGDSQTIANSVNAENIPERMVIPLISENKWRHSRDTGTKKTNINNDTTDALQRQAVDELISESKNDKEDDEVVNSTLAIPILMKNKIPEGFETEDKLDVALRPSEPKITDYDEVPIEQFGMAMLRGMGWNDGEGVGKDKKMVAPIDAVSRPKGLGLGADRSATIQLNAAKQGPKPGDKQVDKLQLTKGACCVITSGPHKDMYGMLQGVDEDNARVMIKLAIGAQAVTSSQYAISLVTKQEYDKSSKVLNQRKVDQYKEEQEKRRRAREKSADKDDRSEDQRHHNRDSKTHTGRKRKHKDRYKDDDGDNDVSDNKDSNDEHKKASHHKHKHRKQSDSGSSDRETDRQDSKHDRPGDSVKSRNDRERSHHHRHHKHKHSRNRERDGEVVDKDGDDREHVRTKSDDKRMSGRRRNDVEDDSSDNSEDDESGGDSKVVGLNRLDKQSTQGDNKMEAKIKNIRNMTSSASSNGNRGDKPWLHSQIRVRIIDKMYKKGQFYNTKVSVVDVLSEGSCVCRTDTGTILEGLSQKMLETVVPRDDDAFVLVVSGKYSGQLAQIRTKDKQKCQVTVQMLRDRDDAITLDYEAICEYTGDINDEFDY